MLGYAKTLKKTSPEVERWFREKKPATEATIRQVREVILGADSRMSDFVKYGTLTFGYDGDFATFVQVSDKKQASVMFNRGARIPGTFPHLEGSHPSARLCALPIVLRRRLAPRSSRRSSPPGVR